MTVKQKQFNPDKIRLLDDTSVSFIGNEKPSLTQVISDGAQTVAEELSKIPNWPVGLKHELVERKISELDKNANQKIFKRVVNTIKVAGLEVTEKEELSRKLSKIMLLGSSAVTTSIEFVPGAWEGLVGFVGVSALQTFGNSSTWPELVASSVAAGAATGAVTGAEQVLAGTLMSGTVRRFPKMFRYFDEHRVIPISEKNKVKASNATGIILGAPVAVIEQNFRDPDRDLKQDLILSATMSGKVALFNTLLISAMGVGVQTLDKIGMETTATNIEHYAKNPAIYIGLFGLIKYLGYKKNKKQFELYNSSLPED